MKRGVLGLLAIGSQLSAGLSFGWVGRMYIKSTGTGKISPFFFLDLTLWLGMGIIVVAENGIFKQKSNTHENSNHRRTKSPLF